MHACMYACMHVCMHVCIHVCMYVLTHVCACTKMYALPYVCTLYNTMQPHSLQRHANLCHSCTLRQQHVVMYEIQLAYIIRIVLHGSCMCGMHVQRQHCGTRATRCCRWNDTPAGKFRAHGSVYYGFPHGYGGAETFPGIRSPGRGRERRLRGQTDVWRRG
jgi:hypothetical protein